MDAFDPATCERYDRVAPLVVEGYHALHDAVAWEMAARLGERARVLVVGCGTGAEVVRMAATRPRWTFVAQDQSEEMLAVARARCQGIAVSFVCGEVEEGGFDGATCLLVGHFVPGASARTELYQAVIERVSPGAPVAVAEWVSQEPGWEAAWRAGAEARGLDPRHHDRLLEELTSETAMAPPEAVEQILASSGLAELLRLFQSHGTVGWVGRRAV